jgi:Family of unknown function (DUF6176)
MVSAAGLAARLGAGIMRAMAEHPKRPASIPEGLVVELSRGKVLPGASAEADRWMAMLNDRLDEAVATLDRERMAIEIVFRLKEGDDEYLYWVSVRGAHGAGLDLQTPIDRDHEAQARRTKEPGWVEAEPQLLLLPDPVRRAVLEWALRGRANSQQRSEAATGDVVPGDASPEAGIDSGGQDPFAEQR